MVHTRSQVLLLLAALSTGEATTVTTTDPGPLAYQLMNRYTVKNAEARGAVCNDGSAAAYYYRNCTANGDRQHGDQTNYCLKGDPNGVLSTRFFLYLSPGDSSWCHDAVTCNSRAKEYKSSEGLPDTLFPGGVLSIYPEANPNFYKQHTILIPSCSSDLFVGNRGGNRDPDSKLFFAGQQIVKAVLEDLAELRYDGVDGPLQYADQVVLAGGPGAMLLQDTIADWLSSNMAEPIPIKALCDGCVLPMVQPLVPKTVCTNDSECPPTTSLALAAPIWKLATSFGRGIQPVGNSDGSNLTTNDNRAGVRRLQWCGVGLPAWRCLMADQLLLGEGQPTRILLQSTQLDITTLAMNGVTLPTTAAGATYAAKYAGAVRTVASKMSFAFTPGCLSNGTALTGMLASDYYYFAQINCSEPGVDKPFLFEPTQFVATFLTNPMVAKLQCIDAVATVGECQADV